jgi:Tfp pilus assembly protein PilZ
MIQSERRITPRYNRKTPLSFHKLDALSERVQCVRALNISSRGIYFATSVPMAVGEPIEILLEMPKRITGLVTGMRRFTARVTHVEPIHSPDGDSGIGVQLLYYENDLPLSENTPDRR